jgi:REP element-mobilizing transposase RayT
MARPLRVEYPGAFYHVINRGNAGENLFKSKRDREKFLEYIEMAADRFSIVVHIYCLMNNHYHFLLETPHPNLSKAMQWVNVSYASYYNRKRKRNGHLFQGRFKSILVQAEEYLKQLSRYIHLNPVRAKLVEKPVDFQWSSYPAYIGVTKAPAWLETDWLLSQFAQKKPQAKKRYKSFVESVPLNELENLHKNLIGGFILGTQEFADWVKNNFLYFRNDEKEIPQLKQLIPMIPLEFVIEAVAREFGCDQEMILKKGLKKNMARDIAIYLARDLTGKTGKCLAECFRHNSGSSITRRCSYVTSLIDRNKRIRRRVNRLKQRIVNNQDVTLIP